MINSFDEYEKAKTVADKAPCKTYTYHNHPYQKGYIRCLGGDGKEYFLVSDIEQALLEYRRQHNIFELGDKVVSINSAFLEYQGVLNIDFINRFDLMLSDDCNGFEVNAICGWSKIIRHATDAEIKVGHRL